MTWTRRRFLSFSALGAGVVACGGDDGLAGGEDAPVIGPDGASCRVTTPDALGPFFVAGAPMRMQIAGPDEPGERLEIAGQIVGADCAPIAGALVDVWQADRDGNYHAAGEDYRLRGVVRSGVDGRFSIDTIRPGNYQQAPGAWRPAHLHMTFTHPSFRTVTTQVYFAGDPYLPPNDSCTSCGSDDPDRVIALQEIEISPKAPIRWKGDLRVVLAGAALLVAVLGAGCGGGGTPNESPDAGDVDAVADASLSTLADPPDSSAWILDRPADETLDTMAAGPGGSLWIGGRLGLLAERSADGAWNHVDLGALLEPYAEPRGEWLQFLIEGDDIWIVGALGFYRGGVVRRHQGSWSVEYDELRDTPPILVGGPFSAMARGPDGKLLLPGSSFVVNRGDDGGWSAARRQDSGISATAFAAAGGQVIGVGPEVWVLDSASTASWDEQTARTAEGAYVLSAVIDETGSRIHAVANLQDGSHAVYTGDLAGLTGTTARSALNQVALLGPGDAWAVGLDGLILRHGEAGWREVPGPAGNLAAIARVGDAVYVGSNDGAVYRYAP